VVTLLPLSRHPHWIIRGLDFPRLQFAAFGLGLLLAQPFFLDFDQTLSWVLIGLTAACVWRQALWIAPYTALWPVEVKAAKPGSSKADGLKAGISILTANVLTPNKNADALIKLVAEYNPDVLVTLESDHWWQSRLDQLEAEMPYTIKCPLDNLYGMHVYSRLPVEEANISFLVEKDVPSMHCALVLPNGERVRMHFVHPAPPSPTENTLSSERDAELVIVGRSVRDGDCPVIVTGDFNDVAWSATTRLFRKISGLLDPRIGRGMFNSFHADYPFLRWPLDHIFHSHHFALRTLRRLPSIGSDHFPILTELEYNPSAEPSREGLKAKEEDLRRARSKANKEAVTKADVPEPGE